MPTTSSVEAKTLKKLLKPQVKA